MAWPSNFPLPLLSGYGIEAGSNVSRTDMETGPARVRRRGSAAPDAITLRYVLTAAQMVIFRALWDSVSDFNYGANWMSLTVKTGRSAVPEVKQCRPTSPFKASLASPTLWLVEIPVEVRNA